MLDQIVFLCSTKLLLPAQEDAAEGVAADAGADASDAVAAEQAFQRPASLLLSTASSSQTPSHESRTM